MVCKIINLSIPNLACFAPWRESIPVFDYSESPENMRYRANFEILQCKVRKKIPATRHTAPEY
jgi:hypothetical protein